MAGLALLDCAEIDLVTFLLTVREQSSERHWFRDVTRDVTKTYLLDVRAGGFLDGDTFVTDSERSWRLWEMFMAWRAEQKLDAYVGISAPYVPSTPYKIYGALPPVPVPLRR